MLALIAYIVLGSVALAPGRTLRVPSVAFVLALCAAACIISMALLRDPAGPLAWLS